MEINEVEYILEAKYALFSNPVFTVGGEKCSYQVPTYEAIKRITENIYWKPTIIWEILEITVLNEIDYETKSMLPVKDNKMGPHDLSYYTYLKNVKYKIKAKFKWNTNYPQFANDRNPKKHKEMFERALKVGGRKTIFAGTSECPAYVYPANGDEISYYDNVDKYPIGYMYRQKGYPNENKNGEENLYVYLENITLNNGKIRYSDLSNCDRRTIKKMSFYNFEEREVQNEFN